MSSPEAAIVASAGGLDPVHGLVSGVNQVGHDLACVWKEAQADRRMTDNCHPCPVNEAASR
jgi:hypothetical protein